MVLKNELQQAKKRNYNKKIKNFKVGNILSFFFVNFYKGFVVCLMGFVESGTTG